jgi:nucleolar complex protein 2
MDHESGEEKRTVEDGTSISLSTALVETWCAAVKEKQHFGALKNLLRAFRTACHYGDGESEDMGSKFNISSSHVFNKIMLYVLVEIDGVFKKMLGLADMSEKKGGAVEVQKLSKWKKLEPFVKKASVIFLAAFPILARKYMKVNHSQNEGYRAIV